MTNNLIPNTDDTGWPLVVPQDDGLRPGGAADRCFYCDRALGTPHGRECVVVTKKVKIQYIIEDEVTIPHFWTSEDLENHRNRSSWCADNAMEDIDRKLEHLQCACSILTVKFVSVVDLTPRREVKTEEQVNMDNAMRGLLHDSHHSKLN